MNNETLTVVLLCIASFLWGAVHLYKNLTHPIELPPDKSSVELM